MQVELNELELRYAGLRVRDAARAARMRASLAADGQQSAVTVICARADAARRFVLIDGYLRVSALRTIGRDVVDAVSVELGEPDALIMAHRLDEVGRRTALEDGWLLDELMEHHGLKQDELGKRLSRSRSWVSRRLALVLVLPDVAQRAVRDGFVPAQSAMKYLVPLSRDKRAACERIVTNLGREPITERQVQRLYTSWRTAHPELRERIELYPRLFLQVEEATRDDEKSDTQLLVSDLSAISGLCFRARRRLVDGVVDRTKRRLRSAFREAQRAFTTLTELMTEEEERDARPVQTHRDPGALEAGARSQSDCTNPGLIA
jgi:ParB family transcriptional regulator, chromosome partitioning protein